MSKTLFTVILLATVTPLKIIDQKVYQTTPNGRVLTEKGYYNLKDKSHTDGKGRKIYIQPFTIIREKNVR